MFHYGVGIILLINNFNVFIHSHENSFVVFINVNSVVIWYLIHTLLFFQI